MKKNMGTVDRALRVGVALVVAVLYFTNQITGVAALILGAIALIFVLTSAVGTCPLYIPLGLNTSRQKG